MIQRPPRGELNRVEVFGFVAQFPAAAICKAENRVAPKSGGDAAAGYLRLK